jgi:hypothetical protein
MLRTMIILSDRQTYGRDRVGERWALYHATLTQRALEPVTG